MTRLPLGFIAAWSAVGTTYSRPSLVRIVKGTKGVLCSSSRMRGIIGEPCHSSLALHFQQLDRIAQLGGALVELARDGDFHFALHDFDLRERAFRADLF